MATYSTAFQTPGSWSWPDDLPAATSTAPPTEEQNARSEAKNEEVPREEPISEESQQPKTRHWRPRTCRICLETVLPTVQPMSEYLPDAFQTEPKVTYESEGGRLIRPCKCKGSSRYVHESCLQEWRHSDPGYSRLAYWQCPTCHFQYRLERMRWGRWIGSQATQLFLTFSIFFLAVFVLGFIADPIINLYLDPYNIVSSLPTGSQHGLEEVHFLDRDVDSSGWMEHFIKGFASLGLLGMIKVFLMGSAHMFRIRLGSWNNRGTTGRDRVDTVTWFYIIIGVCTFLYMVWKMVRAWSRRTLEKASEHIIDVQGDDDDDDYDETETAFET